MGRQRGKQHHPPLARWYIQEGNQENRGRRPKRRYIVGRTSQCEPSSRTEVVGHRDHKTCQCRADIRLSPAIEQLARDIISPQDSVAHRSTPGICLLGLSCMLYGRHGRSIMQKMQVYWVAHLVRLAEKLGLTMP